MFLLVVCTQMRNALDVVYDNLDAFLTDVTQTLMIPLLIGQDLDKSETATFLANLTNEKYTGLMRGDCRGVRWNRGGPQMSSILPSLVRITA